MDRLDVKRMQVLDALASPDAREGLRVGHVMTATPDCIATDTSVLELIKLFHSKRFRHLLVTDGEDHVIGVISDRDVLRCLGPDRDSDSSALVGVTAAAIMSTDVVFAAPDMPLARAVTLMIDQGISCLPVLAEGALIGIVTNTDLHVVLQILLEPLRTTLPAESDVLAGSNPRN